MHLEDGMISNELITDIEYKKCILRYVMNNNMYYIYYLDYIV